MHANRESGAAMIKDYVLPVAMRDGVMLSVDVYRPDAPGRFPVLYTCAMHNKDLQRVEVAENLKVGQPAWSTQWYGVIEAGDSKRFVANGYVHVIGQSVAATRARASSSPATSGTTTTRSSGSSPSPGATATSAWWASRPSRPSSGKTVLHKVFHSAEHPSHLLLPVIPLE